MIQFDANAQLAAWFTHEKYRIVCNDTLYCFITEICSEDMLSPLPCGAFSCSTQFFLRKNEKKSYYLTNSKAYIFQKCQIQNQNIRRRDKWDKFSRDLCYKPHTINEKCSQFFRKKPEWSTKSHAFPSQ